MKSTNPEPNLSTSASRIKLSVCPYWVPDALRSHCLSCGAKFSFFNRRHHCRNCGEIFDGRCSSNFTKIPFYKCKDIFRVCDKCYSKTFFSAHARNDNSCENTLEHTPPIDAPDAGSSTPLNSITKIPSLSLIESLREIHLNAKKCKNIDLENLSPTLSESTEFVSGTEFGSGLSAQSSSFYASNIAGDNFQKTFLETSDSSMFSSQAPCSLAEWLINLPIKIYDDEVDVLNQSWD